MLLLRTRKRAVLGAGLLGRTSGWRRGSSGTRCSLARCELRGSTQHLAEDVADRRQLRVSGRL